MGYGKDKQACSSTILQWRKLLIVWIIDGMALLQGPTALKCDTTGEVPETVLERVLSSEHCRASSKWFAFAD